MSAIFYRGGALPANHRTYIAREADEEALETLLDGEYLHLIAPRQIGKTSLLRSLSVRLQELGWRCAYVDFSLLTDLSKTDWYAELGRALGKALTPGSVPELTNQIDLRNYLLEQALYWRGKQPRLALLFDEVEGVAKAKDNTGLPFSDTFFMMLRNLYIQRDDYDGTISLAFAGATDPSELVQDMSVSPFNIGAEIMLNDFTESEMRQLTQLLELAGIMGDEAFHQAIHSWTDGHPYLAQSLCLALEKQAHNRSPIALTAWDVDAAVEQNILNRVNPSANLKHMTRTLGHLSPRAAALWARLQSGQSPYVEEVGDELFRELYLSGAVKMLPDERIVIRNRIYAKAFEKKKSPASVPEESPLTAGKQVRIFISSTWQDLQPEREAVERALNRMQDTSFTSMQYFGSRHDTPEQFSVMEVERCDIYVGIFAHRYGSGITEKEYRCARARNIPCLVYFKDDSVPVAPVYFERDAAAIASLQALKSELQAQHIVSFFVSPDHLASQVLADLHNRLGTQDVQASNGMQSSEVVDRTVTEPLY
ncbi:MAG: AAA-like domain-containing protein [Chloroflexota bacterium]|nr:AAA-like domain-containing protein [Chloroflexota bacterium]